MLSKLKHIAFFALILLLWNSFSTDVAAQTITRKEQMYGKCERLFFANKFDETIQLGLEIIKLSRRDRDFKYETIELVSKAYAAKNDNYNAERWARIYSNAQQTEYARCLYIRTMMSNEKYEKALELTQKWLEDFPDSKLLNLYKASCDSAISWYTQPRPLYNIRPLAEINSKNRDFSPVHVMDTLIFCSDRIKAEEKTVSKPVEKSVTRSSKSSKRGKKFKLKSIKEDPQYDQVRDLNLYKIPLDINKDSLDYGDLSLWKPFDSKKHEGPSAILKTDTIETIFFTGNITEPLLYEREKKKVLHIYKADLIDGEWTKPEAFYPVNEDLYSCAHPAIGETPNKLYFISNNPKGYGGTDIYYTEFKNGLWGKPVNLGPEINTAGNEMFPFISGDVLYFSSDGHPGMGKLDVFEATLDYFEGTWTHVTNLRPPVNSPFDDFGFSTWEKPHNIFFSSNRTKNSYNDELYAGSRKDIETIYLDGNNIAFESNRFFDHLSFSIYQDDQEVQLKQDENLFSFTPEKEKTYNIGYTLQSFKQNEVELRDILHNTKTEIFRDEVKTSAKPINIVGTLKRGGLPVANHDVLILKNGIPLDTVVTNHNGEYGYVIPKEEKYEIVALTRAGEEMFKQKEFVEVDVTILARKDSTPFENVALNTSFNEEKHKTFITDENGRLSFTAKREYLIAMEVEHKGYFKVDTSFNLATDSVQRLYYEYTLYLDKRKDFPFIGQVISKTDPEHITLINSAEINVVSKGDVIDQMISTKNGMFTTTLYDGEAYNLVISKPGYFQLDTLMVAKTSLDTNIFELRKIEKDVEVNLDNIYFDFNSYLLNEKSKHTLENLIRFMKQNPLQIIQISAHTDARGNDDLNMELSQKRAEEIKKYLVTAGVNRARMKSVGYGESKLLIPDAKTDAEHEQNRRSQFKVINQLTYAEFQPEDFLKSDGVRYFLKLAVTSEPLGSEAPIFKTFPEVMTAINGKEIVYFLGPFERKTQIELEMKRIEESGIDLVPVGVTKYRNKKEVY